MPTLNLTVPSISCKHCVHTIQTELGEVVGVQRVAADLATKQVVVEFDLPATEKQIDSLMAEIGYPAEPMLAL